MEHHYSTKWCYYNCSKWSSKTNRNRSCMGILSKWKQNYLTAQNESKNTNTIKFLTIQLMAKNKHVIPKKKKSTPNNHKSWRQQQETTTSH